ncbi:PaaX family transcriptional regulator [Streptomyces zingiberis]|uniref:PaaX family transcriptional regulator n=1 Tax=Streptomyces zingiberis TaxID=2053010 RepID=A0ABX1BR17_9ACTN|nr:PaaX family transcriptional regulator C-terminal domain-containing protein [Streptomyces zingiberis]NJQ00179.1 PaaX family transcriptional regulator [Streptomyces zingiberis]
MQGAVDPREEGAARSVRPQALMLALFGDQILGRSTTVSTGSVIAVLDRLGVSEHATRATAARMVRHGLLRSVRQGRQAFLGLTPHGSEVLRDGRSRLEADVVDHHWDGRWTLLTFSVPESRRADRHALRTRLAWAGFGMLRSGLWVSPREADVSGALAGLELLGHAQVFRAEAALWTDPARIVREAWDLPATEAAYQRFIDRWADGGPRREDGAGGAAGAAGRESAGRRAGVAAAHAPGARTDLPDLPDLPGTSGAPGGDEPDDLSRRILLTAEWLLLVRNDPRLPSALLPEEWSGVRAQRLFRALLRRLVGPADKLAGELLETTAE